MTDPAIIEVLARIEARQARIEAMLARMVDPQPVSTVAAEINHVRLAGGDLAQHFRDKFAASKKSKAVKATRRSA